MPGDGNGPARKPDQPKGGLPPRGVTPGTPKTSEGEGAEEKKDTEEQKPEKKVTPDRRQHILDGDGKGGGGHGPGRNTPDKSEFPGNLSDDRIIQGVEEIANDPQSKRRPGNRPDTEIASGQIDGVPTDVVYNPKTGNIITAYPTNVPRNSRK